MKLAIAWLLAAYDTGWLLGERKIMIETKQMLEDIKPKLRLWI